MHFLNTKSTTMWLCEALKVKKEVLDVKTPLKGSDVSIKLIMSAEKCETDMISYIKWINANIFFIIKNKWDM